MFIVIVKVRANYDMLLIERQLLENINRQDRKRSEESHGQKQER